MAEEENIKEKGLGVISVILKGPIRYLGRDHKCHLQVLAKPRGPSFGLINM